MKVIFKKEGCEILAVFPEEIGNTNVSTCVCYAHIGQHSQCDVFYAKDLKAASQAEYADLLAELESIGYDDLTIAKRFNQSDFEKRKLCLL